MSNNNLDKLAELRWPDDFIDKVVCGDCLEVMQDIPALSIDVIITDPPFFTPAVHYQSRTSWGRCWADMSILGQFFFDIAKEFKRILKREGHLFIFCHDESYPVFYPVIFGQYKYSKALIWDKEIFGLGNIFRHKFEIILWAHNKSAIFYNDGKPHSDILSYRPTPPKQRQHPVEKPVDLIIELLSLTTKRNDVVLDAFLGSGTTAIACKKLRRRFIGIDMNPEYCKIAEHRLAQTAYQPELAL